MNTAQFLLISFTTLTAMHTAKLFLKEGPICRDPAWPAGLNSKEVEFLHGVCRDPFFHRHAVPEDLENQTTENWPSYSDSDNTTTSSCWSSRRHIPIPHYIEWLPYILMMQIGAQLLLLPVVAAGISFGSSPPTPNGPQQKNVLSASTIIVCVLLVSFNSLMLRCLDFKMEDNAVSLHWPLTICECWLHGQGQLASLFCSIGISREELAYSRLLIATTTVFVALVLASRLVDLIRKRHHHQPLPPSTAINHCRRFGSGACRLNDGK